MKMSGQLHALLTAGSVATEYELGWTPFWMIWEKLFSLSGTEVNHNWSSIPLAKSLYFLLSPSSGCKLTLFYVFLEFDDAVFM
jgi:hypothetical protein